MRSNGHLPPLSALRAFEAAARLQSFSKAADELNVTPAAISHQIHALEEDLGVSLFNRRNRAVELTASARVLLPGLSDAFAGIQTSVRRLRSHNDTGMLTVTASPSFAGKWLVQRLFRFQQRHPDIDVRISATDVTVDLLRGDFDIAIRYGTGRYPGLVVELLLKNEVFPACSPALLRAGPPLETPADLRNHQLIHDQQVDRDALAPTWSMWLKAAEGRRGSAGARAELQQQRAGAGSGARRPRRDAGLQRGRRRRPRRGAAGPAVLALAARQFRLLHRDRARRARTAQGQGLPRLAAAGGGR